MKILVVGGSSMHEVPERERFDVRLTQYLSNRAESPAALHLAVPGTLADAVFALRHPFTRLDDYDVIILQTGDVASDAFRPRANSLRWQARTFLREITGYRNQQMQLRDALALLEAHRSRVVVLTPPPGLGDGFLGSLLRRWQSARLESLCRLWAFRVVNQCQRDLRYEFLFDPISYRLNSLGHHYLSLEIVGALRLPSPKGDEPAWL